ncbi:MAG: PLDc N-terminal domain-containing protein [Aeromicrobium sp.]
MGKALIIVVGMVLFVYALFDLIATPSRDVRILPKPLWFLAILVVPIGPLLWVFVGSKPAPRPPQNPPNVWRRPDPKGPDDDPDYLRGL